MAGMFPAWAVLCAGSDERICNRSFKQYNNRPFQAWFLVGEMIEGAKVVGVSNKIYIAIG